MSNEISNLIVSGNVSIAFDDKMVQSVFDDGDSTNQFALGVVFEEPDIMRLFFNEKNQTTGETVTRSFKFHPRELTEAISKTILVAKDQKEDCFT